MSNPFQPPTYGSHHHRLPLSATGLLLVGASTSGPSLPSYIYILISVATSLSYPPPTFPSRVRKMAVFLTLAWICNAALLPKDSSSSPVLSALYQFLLDHRTISPLFQCFLLFKASGPVAKFSHNSEQIISGKTGAPFSNWGIWVPGELGSPKKKYF